ncbi:hypothetical protein LTR36_007988 [Oleoguttula mirabilis]|uniref:Uncharacterized protein n=1 Tax=Oleoguttula mirabilis TaxID=1507867 RepID=A0AAV9J925_9PEZI|nr:hypothetical protein LTR36_007988 [Oleoguttula mirabilis]
MGNAQSTGSNALTWKLRRALPDDDVNGWYEKIGNDSDRAPFIHAIITVMTNNGQLDLQNYDFSLLYSRRDNDRVVARIVAEKEGVILAKIEPVADGKDQKEAFRALKRHVEMKLDRILQDVPSDGAAVASIAGPSRAPPAGARSVPVEAPPAYGSDIKTGSRKN